MTHHPGFFINHHTTKGEFNQLVEITSVIVFASSGLVFFESTNGIVAPEEFKDDFPKMDFGHTLSRNLGKFESDGKTMKITFPLGDPMNIEREYVELVGSYSPNKMILDYNQCNWSERVEGYYKRTLAYNLKFKFYSTSKHRYLEEKESIIETAAGPKLKDVHRDYELFTVNNELSSSNDEPYSMAANFLLYSILIIFVLLLLLSFFM